MRRRIGPFTIAGTVQHWFSGGPAAVPALRRWLEAHTGQCPELDDILLVASELAANAILHSASGHPGGGFTARLRLGGREVRISITDEGPRRDEGRTERDVLDGYGNGLVIVGSLVCKVAVRPGKRSTTVTAWIRRQCVAHQPAARRQERRPSPEIRAQQLCQVLNSTHRRPGNSPGRPGRAVQRDGQG